MNFKLNENAKELIRALVIAGSILVVLFYLVSQTHIFFRWLGDFIRIIMPFIFGAGFAFLLMPLSNHIEKKWLKKVNIKDKAKRKVAVFGSILFLVCLIALVLSIIIPQIYTSAIKLSETAGNYIINIEAFLSSATTPQIIREIVSFIWLYSEELLNGAVLTMKESLPQILNHSVGFVKAMINVIIGVFIAIYLMLDKERFIRQTKKIGYSIFPEKTMTYAVEVSHLTTKMFNAFIVGKTIDSVIIGFICFFGMTLMGMEYAVLISVIIGITNMIPIFGPFIGAVPGFLILFIHAPLQALGFAVWVLILQQFDGNVLGPYILGDSVGLPSFWVMFAIIVGGGFFGVVGMFLGVPIFAVVYILVKNIVEYRLNDKNIVVE